MENTHNQELYIKVENALDRIRPYLRADGGDVEVVEISSEKVLRVRLLGACENCNMSEQTIQAGIVHTIRRDVPEIIEIVEVNAKNLIDASACKHRRAK